MRGRRRPRGGRERHRPAQRPALGAHPRARPVPGRQPDRDAARPRVGAGGGRRGGGGQDGVRRLRVADRRRARDRGHRADLLRAAGQPAADGVRARRARRPPARRPPAAVRAVAGPVRPRRADPLVPAQLLDRAGARRRARPAGRGRRAGAAAAGAGRGADPDLAVLRADGAERLPERQPGRAARAVADAEQGPGQRQDRYRARRAAQRAGRDRAPSRVRHRPRRTLGGAPPARTGPAGRAPVHARAGVLVLAQARAARRVRLPVDHGRRRPDRAARVAHGPDPRIQGAGLGLAAALVGLAVAETTGSFSGVGAARDRAAGRDARLARRAAQRLRTAEGAGAAR